MVSVIEVMNLVRAAMVHHVTGHSAVVPVKVKMRMATVMTSSVMAAIVLSDERAFLVVIHRNLLSIVHGPEPPPPPPVNSSPLHQSQFTVFPFARSPGPPPLVKVLSVRVITSVPFW